MKKEKNILIGVVSAILGQTIYGMSFIFTKQATQIASPLSLLVWRFLVAFLIMSIFVALGIVKIDLRQKNIFPLLKIAFFFPVIYFIGETFGVKETTATESGVALAAIPIFAIIASTFMIDKRPTKKEIIGVCITFTGVITTVLAVGNTSSFSLKGYIFLGIAVISCAIYCVLVEAYSQYSSFEVTYVMLLVGALVFVLMAIGQGVMENNVESILVSPLKSKNFLLAVTYQGVGCSIIAFILSNVAISTLGVNKMASFIGIATLVSILSAMIFLGESFSRFQSLGAVLIIIGVYVANVNIKNKQIDRVGS